MKAIDALSVNSIRVLAADAIQKANSGHPGLPLGSAPMAYELWANHMNHNPANPKWENRDRFILSGGHGSMLLYSLLHLFGYGLTKEDIMNFRQLGSLTPGHPEYGHTVGVEATTGPLGAGMGMAVGMALAEKHLAAVFNKENYPVVDHYTYVLGGDGCMMEGISSEAFSLAGTMGLSKLIVLYDSNRISIEGSTDLAFRENVEERMKAFGFQTITVEDGTNLDAIGLAIEAAKADTERPSFITIKTEIGYGCPAKQGKASAHGEPLGVDNVKAMRETLPTEEEKQQLDALYQYWLDHDCKTIYCNEVLIDDVIGRFIDCETPLIATARLSGMMLDYEALLSGGVDGLRAHRRGRGGQRRERLLRRLPAGAGPVLHLRGASAQRSAGGGQNRRRPPCCPAECHGRGAGQHPARRAQDLPGGAAAVLALRADGRCHQLRPPGRPAGALPRGGPGSGPPHRGRGL